MGDIMRRIITAARRTFTPEKAGPVLGGKDADPPGFTIISGPTHLQFNGKIYRWTDEMEKAANRYTSATRQLKAEMENAKSAYRAAMKDAASQLEATQKPERQDREERDG